MTATPPTAWSPLRRPLFRALWIADVASNIGTFLTVEERTTHFVAL
jgi:hypothetical protein